jgi:hypothetical protein
LLRGCLESLRRVSGEIASEIIVIDNASPDRSAIMIRDQFAEVDLIASDTNVGFANAVNQGLQRACGDYVFILNPDTIVPQGSLPRLVKLLRADPRRAVAGATLTDEFGRELASVFKIPTLFREFWNFLPELKSLLLNNPLAAALRRSSGDPLPRRVSAVSGAAFLVRRTALDAVGGMDGEFFLYHEELDLCARLEAVGYEIWTEPSAQVIHFDAQSSGYSPRRLASVPLLNWRVLGMDRLWKKHRTQSQRSQWNRQARWLLRLRILILQLSVGFSAAVRRSEIRQRIRNLKELSGKLARRLRG